MIDQFEMSVLSIVHEMELVEFECLDILLDEFRMGNGDRVDWEE